MIRTASLSLTALAVGLAVPVSAQSVAVPPPATVQPIDPTADRLAEDMRRLAANPRDVEALASAGRGALTMGDPNGALGFFLRMQAAAPRDGRAQAGMASALLELERPAEALRLFDEAQRLGLAEAGFAADRGLAYDLLGETARAQRDYQIALTRNRDDETVRRYALSLGIAGRADEAMTQLDPLLRRQDRGAWRARAFVLAMGGDAAAAQAVARQTLPAAMAQMLTPYLQQLAQIRSPGARAFAVHYGQLGGNVAALARRNATLPPGTPARAAPVALAMRAAEPAPQPQPVASAPVAAAAAPVARPATNDTRSGRSSARLASSRPSIERVTPRSSRRASVARDARGVPVTASVAESRRGGDAGLAPAVTAAAPAVAGGTSVEVAAAPVRAAFPAPTPGFGRTGTATASAAPIGAASSPMASVAATPSPGPASPAAVAVPAPAPGATSPVPAPQPMPAAAGARTALATPLASAIVAARPAAGPPAPDGSAPRAVTVAPAAAPGFTTAPVAAVSAPPAATGVVPSPLQANPAERAQVLAGIMAGIEIPPVELAARPVADAEAVRAAAEAVARRRREALAAERAAAEAKRRADAEAKRKADADAARKAAEAAARARPERHWVQVATGSDPAQLARDLRRMAARAPVLKDQKGWSARFGGTRRLLVGPFATAREAVQFMQKAKAAGVDGFNWTSPEGADVDPLPGA